MRVPAARRSGLFGWTTALGAVVALWLDATGPVSAPWQGFFRFDAYARAFDAVFLVTLAIVAINGWNRLMVSFRAVPGSYQPHAAQQQRAAATQAKAQQGGQR